MELKRPIDTRTTEDLLNILEYKEKYRDDVVRDVIDELISRNVNLEEYEPKWNARRRSRANYKRRSKKIKTNATLSAWEKLLIVIAGPFLVAFFSDIFFFQDDPAYKKKNRQAWFYLILGVILWVLTVYLFGLMDP